MKKYLCLLFILMLLSVMASAYRSGFYGEKAFYTFEATTGTEATSGSGENVSLSLVLNPNYYWEGLEAIEVPFAEAPVFKPKAEDYKFSYKLSNAAAGYDVVNVTVKSTMGFVTANNKFVYTEKAISLKGPWDEAHTYGGVGLAGPSSLTTLDGRALMERQGVVDKDGLKMTELSPGAIAKYHVNPSTADLSNVTISFLEKNAEVYTHTDKNSRKIDFTNQNNRIKATPVSPVVDGSITTFQNGVLEIPFQVDNMENLKMFANWALASNYSINPEWDSFLLGINGGVAYGDGKTLPFIAAQLEANDTTVTSDYTVVVPAGIEIIALADNKPDKSINGRSTEFGVKDVCVIRTNHLYESAGYEGQYDTDYYGAIPMPATHTVQYDGIFEFNFIETHYSYTTFTKDGQSVQDKVIDRALMRTLGLHYEYTLVDYIIGKNATGESVHMEQVDRDGNPTSDHKSPYFAPRSVTEDGKTISGRVATREVVDREPLVRVDLVNEKGEIIRYGYVKIRIFDANPPVEAPQYEDLEVTINLSEMYMNCGDEARVTWSQMENLILAKLWDSNGISKQEFEKFYYMDVVGGWQNIPYVDPIAAGVSDPAGTLHAQAAANKWMARRFWKDGNQYKPAQGSSNDDGMALLSKYTNTNNWFGRVWYTPHDNATGGHNWDEATNVIVWNLMGEDDLVGKYAYSGNMTRAAYTKLMQVTGATYATKGLNKKQLSTVIRFVNKNTEASIWVTLLLDVNKLHFATAEINHRVLDHWYDYKEGYRNNTPDTIEVYANVPTSAENGQMPLTTSDFRKDLKEYWLKKEIVPEVYDAKHFTKFWAGNKFLGKVYFQFRLPKSGENTVDIDADSKGKWKVDGISGNTYTLYLKDANKDGFNDEIWAEKNTKAGMSADELICRLSPEGIIEYMGRDKETLKTVGVTPADYEAAPAADKVNGAATDILNLIGMYDNKGNKQKEVYLTGHAKRTFAAYVQIKVHADNCYDPLMGKDYFNVRFLRPINAWPTETSITDAPNATQFIDIWKLLYIRDWRTYAVVPAGQKQKFVDDGITHEGNFKEGNVTYEFYNITNLWVRRHDIRSDAYLEPNKRVALTDPNEIKKLYSVDDIPALTNGTIEYLKIVPLSDFNTDAKKAAYSVDYIGQRASMLYSDLLAYTNNGGVVKPFHIYVPIAIEYPWGALHNWTQTVWATITVDPSAAGMVDGDTFTAETEEGVSLIYTVISAADKTCEVSQNSTYGPHSQETTTTKVTIPETVQGYRVVAVGKNAFYNWTALQSLSLPNTVTSIGDDAFFGCYGLTSIVIPNSVTSIGECTFLYCSGLTSINVESGNTKYDSRYNCNAIIETSSNTLITGCKNTTILNSVTSIGDYAFSGCTGLTSIDIPNSVTSIGNYAFSYCSALTSINVESGNTKYDSRDNCNAIIETSSNTLIVGCKTTTIPNSVTSIGDEAFRGCSGLTSIVIPNSVMSIEDWAFGDCRGLTSIVIPNSVTSIGDNAFCYCRGLTSVTCLAENVPTTSSNAFNNTPIGSATLYVPAASIAAYQTADPWSGFGTIEAVPDVTDISELDNVIYVEPAEVRTGTEAVISLKMKNSAAIRGFQFDLYLPAGVTAVKSSKGKIQASLSAGRLPDEDGHTLSISEQQDGAIRFLCGSQYNETFTGTDGEIATLKVTISEDMEEGDHPLLLKNIKLTESDISKYYETELIRSKLTVLSYILGDVNSDGVVDVSDYIGVANHILGYTPSVFLVAAADVNGDKMIDVSDYIGVANIILTGSVSVDSHAMAAMRASAADAGAGDNAISLLPLSAEAGSEVELSVQMRNSAPIRGFQFRLSLPDGVTVARSGKGKLQASLTSGRLPDEDGHTLSAAEQSDGTVLFLCGSQYDKVFTGSDGEIATITLRIPEDMPEGVYPLQLKDMKLTESDISRYYEPADSEVLLSVSASGNATGINAVSEEKPADVYDLSGRKVGTDSRQLPKGVYIINNKKVVAK